MPPTTPDSRQDRRRQDDAAAARRREAERAYRAANRDRLNAKRRARRAARWRAQWDEWAALTAHVDPADCIPWGGRLNPRGYAMTGSGGSAARLAYERAYGPIPAGMEVDHLCRLRSCTRADHLDAVTHAENLRRGWIARLGRPPGASS